MENPIPEKEKENSFSTNKCLKPLLLYIPEAICSLMFSTGLIFITIQLFWLLKKLFMLDKSDVLPHPLTPVRMYSGVTGLGA